MPIPAILILVAGVAGVATVAAVASAASSSSSSSGSPTGCGAPSSGNPFAGTDYSGALGTAIQTGRDAGEQARAKSEADGRAQFVGYAKAVGSVAGAGALAGDYAAAWYDFGIKLAHFIYGDEYDKANTDEQKARLNADIGKIVSMGFPPAGYVDFADFGARDIADRIEQEFDAMKAVSPHGEAAEIGKAAIFAAGSSSSAPEVKKTITDIFANLAKPTATGIATMWSGQTATYLIDGKDPVFEKGVKTKQGRPFQPGDRPEIDYVAAAAAGLYCAPLNQALAIAYTALNSYAQRRGFTNRNDFLGAAYKPRDPQVTDDIANWLNKYGKADSIVDAWNALKLAYDVAFQAQQKDQAAAIGTALGGMKAPALHL